MRQTIIAGNWKMYKTLNEGLQLIRDLQSGLRESAAAGVQVIVIPPFIHLAEASRLAKESSTLALGAQNVHTEREGAFTGEVAAPMLSGIGVKYVIIGHSERRQYFHETNEFLARKVRSVLAEGMTPIYCCGEMQEERENRTHFTRVQTQIEEGLFELDKDQMEKVVIAYEPVWAIGTGLTASPEQAQEMHAFIRKLLTEKYGEDVAQQIPILYGGSMKPGNAAELLDQTDIDGGLVGGASLKADDFLAIIRAGAVKQ